MKRRNGELSSSSEAHSRLPAAARALKCTRFAGQRSKRRNALRNVRSLTTRKPEPAAAPSHIRRLGGSARKSARPMPKFNRLERRKFPGEFAGASLKPIFSNFSIMFCSAIPRRIRRGLIEAGSHSWCRSVRRLPIPRRIRRGLIEAEVLVELRAPLDGIPRRIRRGLIEAGPRMHVLDDFHENSPANSPGPH